MSETRLTAQPGSQTKFLASAAQIVFYGGSAFGGKTYGQLLDPLRYIHDPHFGAVIFRRNVPQLRNEGGIWDESQKLFPNFGGRPSSIKMQWRFPSGAKIKMSGLEHEKNKMDWQGARPAYLGFEELCQFTEGQFWFLVGRCTGLIRGTCNPDPDSFVAKLIEWWINQKTGYAIRERSGKVRFLCRVNDEIHWGRSPEELKAKFGSETRPLSLTFIFATIYDNPIGMRQNPDYMAKLKALSYVDRMRLLGEGEQGGNWLVRPSAGMYFKRDYFPKVDAPDPRDLDLTVRYWDRAGTEKTDKNDPDASVGLKMARYKNGRFVILDVKRNFDSPHGVEKTILNTAAADTRAVRIGYMQDPGSAGKGEAQDMARKLAGYVVSFAPATGDKVVRCKPASAQAEARNIDIVLGGWNENFIREVENFPGGRFDDQVDGLSGAFEMIAGRKEAVQTKISGL